MLPFYENRKIQHPSPVQSAGMEEHCYQSNVSKPGWPLASVSPRTTHRQARLRCKSSRSCPPPSHVPPWSHPLHCSCRHWQLAAVGNPWHIMGQATKAGELFCPLFSSYLNCCNRDKMGQGQQQVKSCRSCFWSPTDARLAETVGEKPRPHYATVLRFHRPHAAGYQNLTTPVEKGTQKDSFITVTKLILFFFLIKKHICLISCSHNSNS